MLSGYSVLLILRTLETKTPDLFYPPRILQYIYSCLSFLVCCLASGYVNFYVSLVNQKMKYTWVFEYSVEFTQFHYKLIKNERADPLIKKW